MIHLSDRIRVVADQVLSGGVVADIGCDHGFVSIYLVSEGRAAGAIAMDIHAGPLERARMHVREAGLEDRISLRLSDGTERLEPGEADTILISGMGGALMERILRARPDVTGGSRELVLSPQSDIARVRHCLHDLGFRIASETMLRDMGKYYVILRAVPGKEHYFEELEYTYGKCLIEGRNPVFLEFMEKERRRVEQILAGFPEDGSGPGRKRLEQERQEIETAVLKITAT